MPQIFNLEDIKKVIPHREPMLLVEQAIINDDGSVEAQYTIKEDEFFTRGHFPGNPIVPGVIQCEIMAQACSFLVKDQVKGNITLYAGIDKVKFKNRVVPGDVCKIEAILKDKRESASLKIYFCHAKLTVNGKLCCIGDLSFALVPKE